MDLVIDTGNSRTKFRYFENDPNKVVFSFDIDNIGIVEMPFKGFILPQKAIISDVSNSGNPIKTFLQSINVPFVEMSYRLNLPVKLLYTTPETLGSDRIAAVSGANALYPKYNLLVIDAGTAITYDYIDVDGNYKGGNISPGIMLRYKALNTFTNKLPLIEQQKITPDYGTNTFEAIVSGVQVGILYEVEKYISKWCNKSPQHAVILTGGDASFFVNSIKSSIFVNFDLVSIGLKRILDLNAE